jgi:hypothetical protein
LDARAPMLTRTASPAQPMAESTAMNSGRMKVRRCHGVVGRK